MENISLLTTPIIIQGRVHIRCFILPTQRTLRSVKRPLKNLHKTMHNVFKKFLKLLKINQLSLFVLSNFSHLVKVGN